MTIFTKVYLISPVEFVRGLRENNIGGLTDYLVRRNQFSTNSPQEIYTWFFKINEIQYQTGI